MNGGTSLAAPVCRDRHGQAGNREPIRGGVTEPPTLGGPDLTREHGRGGAAVSPASSPHGGVTTITRRISLRGDGEPVSASSSGVIASATTGYTVGETASDVRAPH